MSMGGLLTCSNFKVQDELSKERETKQMLLVGTLQLKNQISSQESHIRECESQINQLKVPNIRFSLGMPCSILP